MSDLVVTVPKERWLEWIAEGDAVGAPLSGEEWGFSTTAGRQGPPTMQGARLYVVAHGMLRGYAPITRVSGDPATGRWIICRRARAVAVTIPLAIPGFRGWRKRWWGTAIERPFADWKIRGVPSKCEEDSGHRAGDVGLAILASRRARTLAAWVEDADTGAVVPVCQYHADRILEMMGRGVERARSWVLWLRDERDGTWSPSVMTGDRSYRAEKAVT